MAEPCESGPEHTPTIPAPAGQTDPTGGVPTPEGRPQVRGNGDALPEDTAPLPLVSGPGAAGQAATDPAGVLRLFGDYQLLGEIAHGGMGVVYRAWHTRLHRYVALKMIRTGELAGAAEVQRFYLEAEAAAQLDHPGIVPVYDVGERDGQHYYAMGLVEGGSLAARVRERPLPPRQAGEILRQVAGAVAYAHGRGIIHRDLKPGNVLLDKDGRPKVTDFGLAKMVRQDSGLTMTGQLLGTPAYMAPEQAAGKGVEVGPATDVYALGATLYCLLTGRPPFHAASTVETLRQVQQQEPASPRQLNPAVDRDLETICLKCLQKEVPRRYGSATELAEDLGRWLAREPIKARPVTRPERLWRWCRRNPLTALLVAGIVVTLLWAVVVSFLLAARARREAAVAVAGEQKARAAQRLSDARLYVAEIARAQQAWREGQLGMVRERLEAQEGLEPDPRGFEWSYLQNLCRLDLRTLRGHQRPVYGIAFSADGRFLASGGDDQTVRVWETATGRQLRLLQRHSSVVWSVAFSPSGQWLAAAYAGKAVVLWDLTTGAVYRELPYAVRSLAFDPAGPHLALTCKDSVVRVVDPATGALVRQWPHQQGIVLSLAYSADGGLLATAGADWDVKIWDAATGKQRHCLSGHTGVVQGVAFSPDGQLLVSASRDNSIKVWDAAAGRVLQTIHAHTGFAWGVAFSPDGRRVASAGEDQMVKVWDPATGREHLTLRGHTASVRCVAFSPDGWRLASADCAGDVKLWDTTAGHESTCLRQRAEAFRRVAFSPDGQTLAAAGDRVVKLWDLGASGAPRTLTGHTGAVQGIAFSGDGRLLASVGSDVDPQGHVRGGELVVWDVAGGNELLRRPSAAGLNAVALHPDGGRLATAGGDQVVRAWDVATGAEIMTWPLAGRVADVAYSPDGRWLAACAGPAVRVWDAATGQEAANLPERGAPVTRLAFSPDGRWLATAEGDGAVRVHDVVTGQEIHHLRGQQGGFQGLAFSPDGRRLATAGRPGGQTVQVWDLFTGQEILTLGRPGDYCYDVAFSPDGLRLAATSGRFCDCKQGVIMRFEVRLWDARPLMADVLARREAGGLVRFLSGKRLPRPELLRAIGADRRIGEDVRRWALDLAGQLGGNP
jgi:WD40 repeat protein/tRNA A-37 threonylcarbamoyl transferase component Bud32